MRITIAAVAVTLAAATAVHAQAPNLPVDESVREQSCKSLLGGTAGEPEQAPVQPAVAGFPPTWPEAPAAAKLPKHVYLRTETQTFNRLYEFATRNGVIYVRDRAEATPWRTLPLPLCFDGRVASISLDDDEMIALDDARRIYTMDNALKDPASFNWTSRWGPPFWTGTGFALPAGVKAWAWSVISPLEDRTWVDPAGNRTAIGSGKVSHIWSLRTGGQRISFNDPWLPPDQSYEMCGPHRGRFKAVNLSASGSFVFVIGRNGDLYTRFYDFDLSGYDQAFFHYSYEDQRGKGDGAPIQLPAAPWVRQPRIRGGAITSAISIHKVGPDSVHRILRVEGVRKRKTGFWERDVAWPRAKGWRFHATGQALTRKRLRTSSAPALGRSEDAHYRMHSGNVTADLLDFNVYCSPARLRVRENGKVRELRLHTVDGLRQQARSRGLDDTPREQYGAIEEPGGKFTNVTVEATRHEIVIKERGWTFERLR